VDIRPEPEVGKGDATDADDTSSPQNKEEKDNSELRTNPQVDAIMNHEHEILTKSDDNKNDDNGKIFGHSKLFWFTIVLAVAFIVGIMVLLATR
jgi:uncharacterized protein YdaL